jgi:hypothetical protein
VGTITVVEVNASGNAELVVAVNTSIPVSATTVVGNAELVVAVNTSIPVSDRKLNGNNSAELVEVKVLGEPAKASGSTSVRLVPSNTTGGAPNKESDVPPDMVIPFRLIAILDCPVLGHVYIETGRLIVICRNN